MRNRAPALAAGRVESAPLRARSRIHVQIPPPFRFADRAHPPRSRRAQRRGAALRIEGRLYPRRFHALSRRDVREERLPRTARARARRCRGAGEVGRRVVRRLIESGRAWSHPLFGRGPALGPPGQGARPRFCAPVGGAHPDTFAPRGARGIAAPLPAPSQPRSGDDCAGKGVTGRAAGGHRARPPGPRRGIARARLTDRPDPVAIRRGIARARLTDRPDPVAIRRGIARARLTDRPDAVAIRFGA